MTLRYEGREVLESGPGQCMYCSRAVTRVLVQQTYGRSWYTADMHRGGYSSHQCSGGPSDDPPLRQAA